MAFDITPISKGEAPALAELSVSTFLDTFGHLYAKRNIDAFLAANHSAGVYEEFLSNPAYGLWFACGKSGAAVGYCVAGPCSLPVPDLPPKSGELMRLYLRKEAQGSGLGSRLMSAALEFLRARYDRIYLGVYSENEAAQRFYQRFGFVKVCDYLFSVGEHRDPEWIMELKNAR